MFTLFFKTASHFKKPFVKEIFKLFKPVTLSRPICSNWGMKGTTPYSKETLEGYAKP